MNPGTLDAALQAVLGALMENEGGSLMLPFELGTLACPRPLPAECYVRVESRPENGAVPRFDLWIAGMDGEVVCQLSSLTVRPQSALSPSQEAETLLCAPQWRVEPLPSQPERANTGLLVVIDRDSPRIQKIRSLWPGRLVWVRPAISFEACGADEFELNPGRAADFEALLEALPALRATEPAFLYLCALADSGSGDRSEHLLSVMALCRALTAKSIKSANLTFVCGQVLDGMMAGFAKAACREHPGWRMRVVAADGEHVADPVRLWLAECGGAVTETEVSYGESGRRIKRLELLRASTEAEGGGCPLRKEGSYLITGGLGGLGLILAGYLVERFRARLVLLGRNRPTEEASAAIRRWTDLGAPVACAQGDVTLLSDVEMAVRLALDRYGELNGVFHLAGVRHDALLAKQRPEEVDAVLGPKTLGTLHLDQATAGLSLDCFVLFSSLSAELGNVGQTDYAAASAFLDRFALSREAQRSRGLRRGVSVSINWPLWREGGMRPDEATVRWMETTWGLAALRTDEGLNALERALSAGVPQVVVVHGNPSKIRRLIAVGSSRLPVTEEGPSASEATGLVARVRERLLAMMADLLGEDVGALRADRDLSEYGFNSMSFTRFSNRLNQAWSLDTTPALFFEYPTIAAMAEHLCRTNAAALEALALPGRPRTAPHIPEPRDAQPTPRRVESPVEPSARVPVAVIGMSGRFPGAPDLEKFWENLEAGRDSISVVPADRAGFEAAAAHLRHGGFIEGVDQFDAEFFGIAPKEAELMDPQQRLFLETVWHAIEDAGYSIGSLAAIKTGVFVGVSNHDYAHLLRGRGDTEAHAPTGVAHSVVANRVSYLLNLRGPSEAVDTACSGSLVALHRAVRAIQTGECTLAIAGGVNLVLTPELGVALDKAGMLSRTGRCRTFARDADGYVRGEGVGAVLLKPLDRAQRDGDRIRGLILGTAVSHGGNANTLTAPNPQGQAEVIVEAFKEAGVKPEEIGYIETHGTGTILGDPIEVNGLKRAFAAMRHGREDAPNGPWCGLGSVKSNLGHLESASGIAGLIKVLLALQKGRLPASLHTGELNPYLKIEGSPFHVVSSKIAWTAPRDGAGRELPRRAGISSFGFGGTNAHVVVEEAPAGVETVSGEPGQPAYLIPVSAKSRSALTRRLSQLRSWLAGAGAAVSLAEIAFNLGAGRDHFQYRLALVVKGRDELREALDGLESGRLVAGTFFGEHEMENQNPARADKWLELLSENAAPVGQHLDALRELARLYVEGGCLDWMRLNRHAVCRRVALPGYPFEPERHWLDRYAVESPFVQTAAVNPGIAARESRSQRSADSHVRANPAHQSLDADKAVRAPTIPLQNATDSRDSVAKGAEGKVQLKRVSGPEPERESRPWVVPPPAGIPDPDRSSVSTDRLAELRRITAAVLCLDASRLAPGRRFVELGLDSILGVELIKRLNTVFGVNLSAATLYDHPTLEKFAEHLASLPALTAAPADLRAVPGSGRWLIAKSGEASDLALGALARRELRPGEVRVRVSFASVILPDLLCVRGLYPSMPEYPFTPGFEFSGVVMEAGMDVERWRQGDLVFGVSGQELGAHAHEVVVPAHLLAAVPNGLPLERACTLPEAFTTAYHALVEVGGLRKAETLLIVSAASGVGLAAIQLARRSGADIVAAAGSEERVAYLHSLGVTRVLDYRGAGFEARLRANLPEGGADVILNLLAGELRDAALSVLAPFGRFLDLAVAGLKASGQVDLSRLVSNQSYHGIDCRRWCLSRPDQAGALLSKLAEMVAQKLFEPLPIHRIYSFAEAKEAYHDVAGRRGVGRTLLAFGDAPGLTTPATFTTEARRARSLGEGPGTTAPATVDSAQARAGASTPVDEPEFAVIGMSGRFPGARDLREFWRNLVAGICTVTEVPPSRWPVEALYDRAGGAGKTRAKWGGFLDGVEEFDPAFFSLSPAEAERMDPQQRLFLMECWKAVEDAGYSPRAFAGRPCGVFVGVGQAGYNGRGAADATLQTLTGECCAVLAGRISYFLDWTGPSLPVDTSCSSALVAVHQACQSLARGECELAIAGGVCIHTTPFYHAAMSQAGMLSPDGVCRAFDQEANGIVPAEGVGVVVLKPLRRALADGDHIYGVIKGTAVNQDGATNGLTAPSAKSQAILETSLYRRLGIDPATIGYVEAHGTGTRLGDPIEIEGLTTAFRSLTRRRLDCAIGTVKTNIGHALTASGAAGLIKALLCLSHHRLVPSLFFARANEHAALESSPFQVVTEPRDWEPGAAGCRRAVVSSFGFSGTNVHAVLEEAPATEPRRRSAKPWWLVTLSGLDPIALREQIRNLSVWLGTGGAAVEIEDLAFTLNAGRTHFPHRRAWVVCSIAELRAGLELREAGAAAELALLPGPQSAEQVESVLRELAARISNPEQYRDQLTRLAALYLDGAEIDWNVLHQGEERKRISLPTYPFRRERYWNDPSALSGPRLCHFRPVWSETKLDGFRSADFAGDARAVLVLHGSTALAERLRSMFPAARVISTNPAAGRGQAGNPQSPPRPDAGSELELAVRANAREGQPIGRVLMILGETGFDGESQTLERQSASSVESCFQLARALDAIQPREPVCVLCVFAGPAGEAQPVYESCAGLLNSWRLEHSEIEPRLVRVDDLSPETIAEAAGREWGHLDLPGVEVTWSKGVRLAKDVAPLEVAPFCAADLPLKRRGVYVITGGMGGLGRIVAEYL
ncbi:MAG: SDR family NAD(P)-dependent oxidoreductase, partial [Verrucomicrobia bacterium]|nr:SDR family NAD(P)-dependent oxidoreductase [Verrucomicrobiota bacterium]